MSNIENTMWEKEFEKNFGSADGRDFTDMIRISTLKSFIRQVREEAVAEEREMVSEGMKKRKMVVETHTVLPKAYFEGYEQPTEDVLSIINQKEDSNI